LSSLFRDSVIFTPFLAWPFCFFFFIIVSVRLRTAPFLHPSTRVLPSFDFFRSPPSVFFSRRVLLQFFSLCLLVWPFFYFDRESLCVLDFFLSSFSCVCLCIFREALSFLGLAILSQLCEVVGWVFQFISLFSRFCAFLPSVSSSRRLLPWGLVHTLLLS